MSEQIEIVGAEMVIVAESVAALAGSGPAVLDARQPPLVEGDRACSVVAGADRRIVPPQQRDKDEQRRTQGIEGNGVANGQGQQDDRDAERAEPRGRKSGVEPNSSSIKVASVCNSGGMMSSSSVMKCV